MLSFSQFIAEMESNENLASLLDKDGGQYGSPDEKIKHLSPTVSHHSKNEWGNHRFVKHDGSGTPLAAIQVMSREKGKGHVANAYTHKDHRRKGYASELLKHAKKAFPHLTYSTDRSHDGEALVKSIKEAYSLYETPNKYYTHWGIIHPSGRIISGDQHPTARSHKELLNHVVKDPKNGKHATHHYATYSNESGSDPDKIGLSIRTHNNIHSLGAARKALSSKTNSLPVNNNYTHVDLKDWSEVNGPKSKITNTIKKLHSKFSPIKEAWKPERAVKGWMSPSGKAHLMDTYDEHRLNHHPEYLAKGGKQGDHIQQAQAHGFVRFGGNMNSMHGFHHFVHYDSNHPEGKKTALKALHYMRPDHNDDVTVSGTPGVFKKSAKTGKLYKNNKANKELSRESIMPAREAFRKLNEPDKPKRGKAKKE